MCACSSPSFDLADEDEDAASGESGETTHETSGSIDAGTDTSPSEDSAVLGDTAAPLDTLVTETLVPTDALPPTDTHPTDTLASDTFVPDTYMPDTYVADTYVPICSVPGKCDDGNACTTDGCNSSGGCMSVVVDKDGDLASPKSLGACGTDCNDSDSNAKPGQLKFFSTPQSGTGGYDYDCNGTEEILNKTLGYCYYDDKGFCVFSPGFITTAPKCGETKLYASTCTLVGEGCYAGGDMITQSCR